MAVLRVRTGRSRATRSQPDGTVWCDGVHSHDAVQQCITRGCKFGHTKPRRLSLHIDASAHMLPRMRTTIDINDRLLAEAKSLAAQRGFSLKALVEEALRERLHGRGNERRAAVELPTFTGAGLQPGVDLTDGAALLEIMDADARR